MLTLLRQKGFRSYTFAMIVGVLTVPFIAGTNMAYSVVNTHYSASRMPDFPIGPHVKKQVHFWELVFSKYPGTSVLIHDQEDPELLIDLVDFKKFSHKYGGKVLESRSYRDKITEKYIARYELAIKRFAQLKQEATKFGPIEKRLFEVYGRKAEALSRLYRGQVSIRPQAGLADEFVTAARRAYQYLPYMEQIFRDEGLPVELTRMAFVESMFNVFAVSKVGASGIWQFMPETARQFMRVDNYFDERNSPLKATHGAAKLLKQNYRILNSWPLAVTAYNHGAGGMKRAVKSTGTSDFDNIIRNYSAKSFGFASKNFYAEFLAARNVYEKFFRQSQPKQLHAHLVPIKLSKPISLHELIQQTPLSRDLITEHNPCLLPRAFSKYRHQPLPKDYKLYVPSQVAQGVQTSLNSIQAPKHRRS